MDRLAQPPLVSSEISAQVQFHIDLPLCPPRPRFEGSNLTPAPHTLPPSTTSCGSQAGLTPPPAYKCSRKSTDLDLIWYLLRVWWVGGVGGPPQGILWCFSMASVIRNLRTSLTPPSPAHLYNQILSDTPSSSICVSLFWLQKIKPQSTGSRLTKRNIGVYLLVLEFWCKHFWVIRVI